MNILKQRGVAIVLTIVMMAAAIGIGQARKPSPPADTPSPPSSADAENLKGDDVPPPDSNSVKVVDSYVFDNAGVLSDETERKLDEYNANLLNRFNVAVAVVTCNEKSSNLGSYAMKYAEEIELQSMDMIVVLDISGENYWLVQGVDLTGDFTDENCVSYAWEYMESSFDQGDYDSAVLSLMAALSGWYESYFE